MTHPLRSTGITPLQRYYEAVRPSPAHRYFRPRGWRRLHLFPLASPARFSRSAPEPDWASRRLHAGCRLGSLQCIPQADPGRWVSPRFWHHLIAFRHFRSGSLTLASPNRTCRNHVPTFPQRSLPRLLTTAACGGLRSTPDCRPRRTCLHLSYSYASPCGPATLVTQDPSAKARPDVRDSPQRYSMDADGCAT